MGSLKAIIYKENETGFLKKFLWLSHEDIKIDLLDCYNCHAQNMTIFGTQYDFRVSF